MESKTRKEFIPIAFELCPEVFRKIQLIATYLLKLDMIQIEYFGTEECSEFQLDIQRQYPHFLSNPEMKVGHAYWVNPAKNYFKLVDKFNPFLSCDDALLVFEEMRRVGTLSLKVDRLRVFITFAPDLSTFGFTVPISFTGSTLENSIGEAAFQFCHHCHQRILNPFA